MCFIKCALVFSSFRKELRSARARTTPRSSSTTSGRTRSWRSTRTTILFAVSPPSPSPRAVVSSWPDTTTSTSTSGTPFGSREPVWTRRSGFKSPKMHCLPFLFQVFSLVTITESAAWASLRTAWPSAPGPGTASSRSGTKTT